MSAGMGELAAFGTAISWGVSNQVQSAAGRLVGPTGVTLLRMPYQLAFIGLLCLLMRVDTQLSPSALLLLVASGLAGISMCDFFLYHAISLIGPSTAVLIFSSGTMFTAVFGRIFLNESLPWSAVAGIGVAVLGIVCVITEHSGSTLLPGQEIPRGKTLAKGVGLAVLASFLMSASLILLKAGLKTGVSAFWATFVRALAGALTLWGIGFMRGWAKQTLSLARRHLKVYWMLLFSCFFGAAGMFCSSLAVQLAPVGVAATIIGLQPISVTLIGAAWYRRRPSPRIIVGIVIAFAGTAMICLR